MLNEFKAFIMRGNVLDLAVGVIIGAAFGKIVTSLVDDIIMPPIGVIIGGIDFSGLYINLSGVEYASLAAAREAKAAVIAYGSFINVMIQFLIVAFAVFILIKAVNKVIARTPAAPAGPTKTEELLTEIRDSLKAK
ncbi:large conductance mechanosensitive channel protein MscL [Zavarzinia compransoris]|uniref:Large-conductance mechanosensitive channel n=1 Tax=Zavarzinia compransoris TaxID=1264899 RepID=A0A317EB80_9PROT|nr:large conductance mechanosensitive channel protein MscL [Zavarzinia compransoris]PWR23971.1 large conductance mechanosensitive channel protein MscL [Zavarzinia compransoris]TDP48224.1 large conductance mechanosensitive channel [Zavarzinia compransoris]